MITYIVKTLLCAAVLFLIYILLLEREKMHRFNRFYLLFSIVFSLSVPFITINTPSPVVTVNELIAPSGLINNVAILNDADMFGQTEKSTKLVAATSLGLKKTQVPFKEPIPWLQILLGLYLVGTAILLLRFIRNLSVLLLKAAYSKKVSYHEATLVLTQDNALPNSFLNYIFIDREKFEEGTIEKEILQHELTHVNQRHSIDILLVELIMVFAWINPLLFLFRRAIKLNHEFLADDAVLDAFNDTESYRLLLFNKVNQSNNLVLSSSFNYLITKKRLIMMTRNTSRKVAVLKQIALIPLIVAIGFFLSTRVIAQDKPKQQITQVKSKQQISQNKPKQQILPKKIELNNLDAPQSVMKEFYAILAKYKVDTLAIKTRYPKDESKEERDKWMKVTHIDELSKADTTDKNRLGDLYVQMSRKQHQHTFVHFVPKPELRIKVVPTIEQFEAWKNDKVYGVWIDSIRVKNAVLNDHSNTDFYYFETLNLGKGSARVLNCKVRVTLLTLRSFDNENIRISFWRSKEPARYSLATAPHIFPVKDKAKMKK